jgi:hypothetical protein
MTAPMITKIGVVNAPPSPASWLRYKENANCYDLECSLHNMEPSIVGLETCPVWSGRTNSSPNALRKKPIEKALISVEITRTSSVSMALNAAAMTISPIARANALSGGGDCAVPNSFRPT